MKQTILSYLPGDHPWQNHILWFDSIDSTNTRAKELAIAGAPHGTVLIADHQSAGRGRMGRSFQSPVGVGIYMSVILRYSCSPLELMHLTCATAVAACDAVEQAVNLRPGIKWTNDLVYEKRKLAGILTELLTFPNETVAIVGIGINCCQKESDFDESIRSFAGSLSMATGNAVDRANVAACLIAALGQMDASLLTKGSEIMEHYQKNCVTVGKDISILCGGEVRHGHAQGVDSDGALLVQFPDGHIEPIQSGEVSIRGMYGYI